MPRVYPYQMIPVGYPMIWIHRAFDVLCKIVIVLSNDICLIRDILLWYILKLESGNKMYGIEMILNFLMSLIWKF